MTENNIYEEYEMDESPMDEQLKIKQYNVSGAEIVQILQVLGNLGLAVLDYRKYCENIDLEKMHIEHEYKILIHRMDVSFESYISTLLTIADESSRQHETTSVILPQLQEQQRFCLKDLSLITETLTREKISYQEKMLLLKMSEVYSHIIQKNHEQTSSIIIGQTEQFRKFCETVKEALSD